MVFKGFLLGIGIFLSCLTILLFIAIIIVSALVIKLRSKYVSVAIWQNYLEQVKIKEDYLEAAKIISLIASNSGREKIKLPKEYDLIVTLRTCDDHPFPFAFNRKVTIIKYNDDAGEKGYHGSEIDGR